MPQCDQRWWYAINQLYFDVMAWQSLIAIALMLFVKSTNDTLQGVSKLDNLLKVSRIQAYRIRDDIDRNSFDLVDFNSSLYNKSNRESLTS